MEYQWIGLREIATIILISMEYQWIDIYIYMKQLHFSNNPGQMNLLHFEIHNRRRVFSLIDVQQTCPYWMIWQYEGISDLRPDGSLFSP